MLHKKNEYICYSIFHGGSEVGLTWRKRGMNHRTPFMLSTLISSKTRLKLLLKFFLNPASSSYLRGLESEFGESTNAIRLELNRFEDAGMLNSEMKGNKKMYRANTGHPLFGSIHALLRNYVGIDHIVENIIHRLGDVRAVYLTGDWANGIESPVIDMVLVGNDIDIVYLTKLSKKAETMLNRKIRHIVFTSREWNDKPLEGKTVLLVYSV